MNDKKTEPTFDSDGYPTDETLETIKTWNCVGKENRAELLEFVKKAWWCGDDYFRKEGHQWRVSTVGWSGNESLIGAMEENFLFWSLCWVQSRRGGHYIFEEEEND